MRFRHTAHNTGPLRVGLVDLRQTDNVVPQDQPLADQRPTGQPRADQQRTEQVTRAPTDQTKGILYPHQLPTFTRIVAPSEVAALVQWFWIPEWELAPGQVSRQHIIGFPASNLVVEQQCVVLAGPSTRRSFKDLSGSGWAVGALLRPAMIPHLVADPATCRDTEVEVDVPALAGSIRSIMDEPANDPPHGASRGERHDRAVEAYRDWLLGLDVQLSDEARTANALFDVAMSDTTIATVTQLAAALDVSTRQLQRIAKKYIGMSPLGLIKRRRIQEAADLLRSDPSTDISALAHDLGFADHAHFSNEFRQVLGLTPKQYRNHELPEDSAD